MSDFGALDISGSGLVAHRKWLDAISDNVANVNTVRPAGEQPFRARLVVARSRPGNGGVDTVGVEEQGGQPQVVYDPENPLADADGYVTRPVVDLGTEMTNMLVAQRLYQANLSVMSAAREAYQSALEIGK
jgi:flagellar basal-body rod protein FlgC